ncbi:hypothetical protein ABZ923_31255 [Streptomyces sp. NPDC046881]|uniref:hypothetical protein n=1 Tax=Streptomyces sp. NPDC046881 TaxID=3155374 RepID=UPI0033CDBB1F
MVRPDLVVLMHGIAHAVGRHDGTLADRGDAHRYLAALLEGLHCARAALLDDVKYRDYNPERGCPPCHRVWLVPGGLDHDAAERIEPVLQAFAAYGSWARPLSLRATSRPQP